MRPKLVLPRLLLTILKHRQPHNVATEAQPARRGFINNQRIEPRISETGRCPWLRRRGIGILRPWLGKARGAAGINEPVNWPCCSAKVANRGKPDADQTPVIVTGDIPDQDITLDLATRAVDGGPIGMGNGNLACAQHLCHRCDMAEAHGARGGERQDGANARMLPLGIAAIGQPPPRPCVAANLYP